MDSSCSASPSERTRGLATLGVGTCGTVVRVSDGASLDRLVSLGVTPGARIRVLQRFPGFVFECDQTELVVEPDVACMIFVDVR
jgi:Fe2+ transport system protein FeoA